MIESIPASPLAWPAGWKRCPAHARKRAAFGKQERVYGDGQSSLSRHRDVTIGEATNRVLDALRRFGVLHGGAIISTNLALRGDGLPRSGQRMPDDHGVAVYWSRPGENTSAVKCMAVDRYDRVADNLAAIAATLEAMRAIERHGGAQVLKRAFTGFGALPAPGATVARGWREVLGFAATAVVTEEQITANYRRLAAVHHPDRGGDTAAFQELGAARMQALQSIGVA